jgi:hypothetical protein
MTNLSVSIQTPSRRLLQEGARLLHGRVLVVSTTLTVKGLTISSDRSVIYIITNAMSTDFSVASIVVDFPGGALVTADGLLFQSTTGLCPLSDPIFQQSLYQYFGKDDALGA